LRQTALPGLFTHTVPPVTSRTARLLATFLGHAAGLRLDGCCCTPLASACTRITYLRYSCSLARQFITPRKHARTTALRTVCLRGLLCRVCAFLTRLAHTYAFSYGLLPLAAGFTAANAYRSTRTLLTGSASPRATLALLRRTLHSVLRFAPTLSRDHSTLNDTRRFVPTGLHAFCWFAHFCRFDDTRVRFAVLRVRTRTFTTGLAT